MCPEPVPPEYFSICSYFQIVSLKNPNVQGSLGREILGKKARKLRPFPEPAEWGIRTENRRLGPVGIHRVALPRVGFRRLRLGLGPGDGEAVGEAGGESSDDGAAEVEGPIALVHVEGVGKRIAQRRAEA